MAAIFQAVGAAAALLSEASSDSNRFQLPSLKFSQDLVPNSLASKIWAEGPSWFVPLRRWESRIANFFGANNIINGQKNGYACPELVDQSREWS